MFKIKKNMLIIFNIAIQYSHICRTHYTNNILQKILMFIMTLREGPLNFQWMSAGQGHSRARPRPRLHLLPCE